MMITKKNMYKYWLFGFLAFCIINIVLHFYYESQNIHEFKIFNEANLNGTITNVSSSAGFVHITIKNEKYEFNPSSSYVNYNLNIGDSIFKPAYADTIVICYKKTNCKKYTFKEYHD